MTPNDVPSPDTAISEEERHAIAHARHQVKRAKESLVNSECCFDYMLVQDLLRVIDRKVPSPDTVGGREALEFLDAIDYAVKTEGWAIIYEGAAKALRAALSSHCTAGRREEIEKRAVRLSHKWGAGGNHAEMMVAFAMQELALTSEQSGPTAGTEEVLERLERIRDFPHDGSPSAQAMACLAFEGVSFLTTPSPPDRQQDQGETSVLPRVNLSGTDFLPMDQVRAIDAVLASPSAEQPVSDASRETLGRTLDCLQEIVALDSHGRYGRLAREAVGLLNSSFDKTGGGE